MAHKAVVGAAAIMTLCFQGLLSFEDKALYFTRQGWDTLDRAQKALYRDVMLDNYRHVIFLGNESARR